MQQNSAFLTRNVRNVWTKTVKSGGKSASDLRVIRERHRSAKSAPCIVYVGEAATRRMEECNAQT
jgi:hypothetical protein